MKHPSTPTPDLVAKAHRLMEWSNVLTVASAAFGITAWFTGRLVLFYITGSIALLLSLIFMWVPVFIGISGAGQGPDINRSVLSEDGLYNLMADLDSLMHCFERLQDRFAADPELDKKIQELEQEL